MFYKGSALLSVRRFLRSVAWKLIPFAGGVASIWCEGGGTGMKLTENHLRGDTQKYGVECQSLCGSEMT